MPSHYAVDGIEEADSLADKETKLKQKDMPITHDIARARIKKQNGRSSTKEPRRS